MPIPTTSKFPQIDEVSNDVILKYQESTIENRKGIFYGPFCKMSNLPLGEGVFKIEDPEVLEIVCGRVRDGKFEDGRRIVVNLKKFILHSVDQITQPESTVLQKVVCSIENDSSEGFFLNGVKVAELVARFNLKSNSQSWLDLNPKDCLNQNYK